MSLHRHVALAGVAAMVVTTIVAPSAHADLNMSTALSSLSSVSSQSSAWRELTLLAGSSLVDENDLKALKFGPTTDEEAAACAAQYGGTYDWKVATCSNVRITQGGYALALDSIMKSWNTLSTGNDMHPLTGGSS